MTYKVCIAGTRTITDYNIVKPILEDIFAELQYKKSLAISDFEIVSGGAKGIDELGECFANEYNISVKKFLADWNNLKASRVKIRKNSYNKEYNALAGFIRNEKMIDYCDVFVAIWDGKSPGTKQGIEYAKTIGRNLKIVMI